MFRNLTLAAMDATDSAALRPHLAARQVKRGEVLIAQGAMVETVHFPTTAYLSNTVTFSDGRSADTFVMGVEGVSGLAPFLAGAPCAWGVAVSGSGEVYEAPAALMRRAVEESPRLLRQLLRLANDYQAQASLGVACASLHHATGRLARYLLVWMDREQSGALQFTQEALAHALGVQRTTVNASALELKDAGAIKYSRGRIHILDRDRLRRASCECYQLQRSLAH